MVVEMASKDNAKTTKYGFEACVINMAAAAVIAKLIMICRKYPSLSATSPAGIVATAPERRGIITIIPTCQRLRLNSFMKMGINAK